MCQQRNDPCNGEDEDRVEKDLEASHPVCLFGHRRPPPERLSHLPRLLAAPFAADDATEDWGDQGSSAFAGMLAAASNTATRDSTTRVNVSIRQLCALERLRGGARPHFSDDLRPNPRVAPARRGWARAWAVVEGLGLSAAGIAPARRRPSNPRRLPAQAGAMGPPPRRVCGDDADAHW